MKLLRLPLFTFLLSILTFIQANSQVIPFDDKRWVIEAQGKMLEPYKGYNSLYLQNGKAWLRDEQFLDGIIEFDIYMEERVSFSGLFFRMINPTNYEDLYFRSHLSDMPDAYQYTPVFNGNAGWQLYHDQYDGVNDGFIHFQPSGSGVGYNGILHYDFNRWMHVKLLVKGTEAELYFDNSEQPSAFIKELKRGNTSGTIGVESGLGATYFANFSFTKSRDIVFKSKPVAPIPVTAGIIPQWEVSSAFKEETLKNKTQLDAKILNGMKWETLVAEKTGLVNLSILSRVSDSTNTVFARIKITSDKDQVKKMNFGYSDRVMFFVNNQLIYSGNNSFRTRDYRYLGTIGYFDAIYLPLKKGENTIILAISETFGGWAVQAKFDDLQGILINN